MRAQIQAKNLKRRHVHRKLAKHAPSINDTLGKDHTLIDHNQNLSSKKFYTVREITLNSRKFFH